VTIKDKKCRNPALIKIKNKKCGIPALKTTHGSNSTNFGEFAELRTKSGEFGANRVVNHVVHS